MVAIRYADEQSEPVLDVSGVGTGVNDGWQIVARLNPDLLPAAPAQIALIVTGCIAQSVVLGGTAQRGLMQVALGTAGGSRHPEFLTSFPLSRGLGGAEGSPFQFLVLVASSFSDALFGTSIDPNTTELVLYARTFLNGDPQTYAPTFRLTDVNWLFFDLAAIPSGHWAAHEAATPAAPITMQINAPNNLTAVSSGPFGASGQKWLCFGNAWYDSLVLEAPTLQFGVVPDGVTATAFQCRIGNVDRVQVDPINFPAAYSARYGQSPWPGIANLQLVPRLHQGGFWVESPANSTTRPALMAYATLGRIYRYRWLGIRIDPLQDVLSRRESGPMPGGVPITGAWEQTFLAVERPRPNLLTQPIVMVHQVARIVGAPQSYGTLVSEAGNGASSSFGQNAFPKVDPGLREAASSVSIGRRVFARNSPEMQWRAHLVGLPGSPAATQQVFDFTFVQFHPVRDPDNVPTGPGTRPPAVVLVPGKQSLAVGALPAPPFPPSSAANESLRDDRPSIAGTTGYRRRWPLGTKAGRVFSLSWTLADADAETLLVWLLANPAWRYTPPRGAAVAVLSTSAPNSQPAGHRAMVVSLEVVVLTYTGA